MKRDLLRYESFYASASTDGHRLYTTSRAGKIVALNIRSGSIVWTRSMGTTGYATPAIADGRVFVGGFDSQLRALRATTGSQLWSRGVGGKVLSPALVVGNLVFVSTLNGKTVGLRVADGKIVWRHKLGAYAPGIATKNRYYFSLNGFLAAYKGRLSPRGTR